MFSHWIRYSILSLTLYGFWGFFGAKASKLIDAKSVFFYSSLGTLLAGLLCLFLVHLRPEASTKAISFSVLTGLTNSLGSIFFIVALRSGPVIPVVMITGLYPLVTLFLAALLLHDHLSLAQL